MRQQIRQEAQKRGLLPTPSRWQGYDLLGYIEAGLHAKLWDKQREIVQSVIDNRRTLVLSANGIGKTWIASAIAQAWVDVAPGIAYTSAPTYQSLVDKLWKEIRTQRPRGQGGRLYETPLLKYSADHFCAGITSTNAEGFQGQHHVRLLGVLDEAPGVALWVWNVLERMCVSPLNRILAIGNPFESTGPFYDNALPGSGWNVIQISAFEHPNVLAGLQGLPEPYPGAVSLQSISEAVEKHCEPGSPTDADCIEWPPNSGVWLKPDSEFEGRVLGRFPSSAINTLITPTRIDVACELNSQRPLRGDKVLGVDPAGFGDDKAAYHIVQGKSSIYHHESVYTDDPLKIAFECKRLHEIVGLDRINVDATGIGAGVVAVLANWKLPVCGVNAAGSPIDPEHYVNVRNEMWGLGHDIFRDRDVDLTRLSKAEQSTLRSQLCGPTYVIDGRGRREVERKKDTKTRTGRSPDGADAFLLARYPTIFAGNDGEAGFAPAI